MNLFDFIPASLKPGDWIETNFVGRELTFEEITQRVGQLIVNDVSTESHRSYKVVQVEKIVPWENGWRRLIYYDGKKQRGLVGEIYFNPERRFPARAYELKIN